MTNEPKIFAVEGGMIPNHKQKPNDVAIDLAVRAVVAIESKAELEEREKRKDPRRKTLFDFITPAINDIRGINIGRNDKTGESYYRLFSGESVSLGLGVVVEFSPGWAGYIQPRSSTIRSCNRDCILTVLNDTVPIDPGFRSEIWAELKNEGPNEFKLFRDAVLFQLIRLRADTRPFRIVGSYGDLTPTDRGMMSNGSTTHHVHEAH